MTGCLTGCVCTIPGVCRRGAGRVRVPRVSGRRRAPAGGAGGRGGRPGPRTAAPPAPAAWGRRPAGSRARPRPPASPPRTATRLPHPARLSLRGARGEKCKLCAMMHKTGYAPSPLQASQQRAPGGIPVDGTEPGERRGLGRGHVCTYTFSSIVWESMGGCDFASICMILGLNVQFAHICLYCLRSGLYFVHICLYCLRSGLYFVHICLYCLRSGRTRCVLKKLNDFPICSN